MLNESNASSAVTYAAVQLGALEIRTWEAIVAGDLRSAQQQLDRADALIDRESDPGTLNQGATLPSARHWVEMELGSKTAASPDDLETGLLDLRFLTRSARRWHHYGCAMRLVRNNDSLGCALMLMN